MNQNTIKVVWVSQDINKIYSAMFESLDDALEFAQSKEKYLVFKLINNDNFKRFSWEILPYGNYKFYKSALKFRFFL